MPRLLVILMSFVALGAFGQNKPLLYGVDDLPQSLLLNPGAAYTYDAYFGVPVLSGISASGGSSGISAWDIFQAGGDINARLDAAIRSLDNRDVFTANQQLEIVSAGWLGRDEKTFYSAGLYQETDFIMYFPKDFALLAYDGNAPYIDRAFEFSDISFTADVLSVYHFGVNKKLSRKLRLGARAKLYMSAANVNSTNNQGFFRTRTTPDGPNFYTHEVVGANVTANSSGLSGIIDNGEGVSSLTSRLLFSSNLGLGLDIGGTYDISNQLSLSASLLDIGFIAHGNNLNTYRLSGSYELDGIELEFPALLEGQSTTEYWEIFLDEAEAALPYEDQLEESYITLRPLKFNGAINYGFGTNLNGECDCTNKNGTRYTSHIGVQFNAIKRPKSVLAAASLYYDKSWWPFLKTKMTYTVDTFSKNNIGLLVSTKIKNFNFYLAADNLLETVDIAKARQFSLQAGMQVVISQK